MARSVSFEAYHYVDNGDGLPRVRSERQDVAFYRVGDSITIVAPPPIAATLFVALTPAQFLRLVGELCAPEVAG